MERQDSKESSVFRIRRRSLTEKDCSKQVSDIHLESISSSCCKYWKKLPAHLELETMVADDIDSNYKEEEIRRFKFLLRWKEIKGSGATYSKLIIALLKIKCLEDAEKVCTYVPKESRPTSLESASASMTTTSSSCTLQPVPSGNAGMLRLYVFHAQQAICHIPLSYQFCLGNIDNLRSTSGSVNK